MKHIIAFTFIAALGAVGAAQAKGHDQGVSDGQEPPAAPGALAGAVDDGQKKGQRGAAASANKGDNRRNPIPKPGQNK